MKKVTIDGGAAVLYLGDNREVLPQLPEKTVQLVVTSPPYWKLRNYGVAGQLGQEPTPEEFVANLVEVFGHVHRILRDDGLLVLNIADCYNAAGRKGHGRVGPKQETNRASARGEDDCRPNVLSLKQKDLVGIPWMLAFALRAAGWHWRTWLPWVKRSPMTESCTDRPANALEIIYLFSKQPHYYWDAHAVRRPGSGPRTEHVQKRHRYRDGDVTGLGRHTGLSRNVGGERHFRNGDLWFQSVKEPYGLVGYGAELVGLDVTNEGFVGEHMATFPPALPLPFILAGTSAKGCCPECGAPQKRLVEEARKATRPGAQTKAGAKPVTNRAPEHDGEESVNRDPRRHCTTYRTLGWEPGCACNAGEPVPCTVLDPFSGAATTALVALKLGRRAVGIELSPKYLKMGYDRLVHRGKVGRDDQPAKRGLFF